MESAWYMLQNAPSYVQTIKAIHLDGVCYRKWRVILFHRTAFVIVEFLAKKYFELLFYAVRH